MLGVIKGVQARRRRAQELLDLVGLSMRLHHLPGQLSGGERQRVAIARSLANSPSLILADEPTGNLDSEGAAKIMDLLGSLYLEQKTALVLVTHNPALAAVNGRWLRMLDGSIVQEGSAGEAPPCAS
jgi:putative ABC transport system ATP-binding protein